MAGNQSLVQFKEAKTCVFWDLEGYPINDGLNFERTRRLIIRDLRDNGYLGELSVHFFVGRGEIPAESCDDRINITVLPDGGRRDKYYYMIVHILLWAVENYRRSNIIVLSKNVDESTVADLEGLYLKGYGILLSDPEPDWLVPQESSVELFPGAFLTPPLPAERCDENPQ